MPLTWYEQHLPHWRQRGATYFVTFRLHDSLPVSKLRQLRQEKVDWLRRNPPPRSHEILDARSAEIQRRIETWLDLGMGRCILRHLETSNCVARALLDDDGVHYELGCFVVMPNHIHAVVRPLTKDGDLEQILQSWKGRSARSVNECLNTSGTVWQRESYDRIIRDPEHLYRVIQYVGRNPTMSKLPQGAALLWIRPAWIELGWNFETSGDS